MSKLPEPPRTITGEIRRDRQQARRSRNSSPFFGTGFHPTGNNGIESDDFDGDIDTGNAGTKGWSFNSLRVVIGELILRAGSLTNDLLANPSSFGFGGNSGQGFSVGTSGVAKTSIAIPIPAGFSRALVHCTVNASANNTTAAYDYLYVSAGIDLPGSLGGIGGEAFSGVDTGGWGNAAASAAGNYDGIGSGSIVLSCRVRAGAAWAADAANIANVDGTVVFLR